jgi:hypothetical protein
VITIPPECISRTTKQLAVIILSPILVWAIIVPVCWTWSQMLKPRTTRGPYFEFCGNDGILPNFVLSISVILAIFALLLAPISLFLDWRRWKKNKV